MSIIYEPRGKAREYSELAVNLMTGCTHGCRYCYCPSISRSSLEEWSSKTTPRKDILRLLAKEASKMPGCQKEVLFSFMTDPCQPEAWEYTKKGLEILEQNGFSNVCVLTKNPTVALDGTEIFKRNPGWKIASTVSFLSEDLREYWEPGAPSIASRLSALRTFHDSSVKTWVSIEPVIDSAEAISVIKSTMPFVDFFKVGKINHNADVERKIDWHQFLLDAENVLGNHPHYIKKDLEKFRNG